MMRRVWTVLVSTVTILMAVPLAIPLGLPAPAGGSEFPLTAMLRSMWAALPSYAADRSAAIPVQGHGPGAGGSSVGSGATQANGGSGSAPGHAAGALPDFQKPAGQSVVARSRGAGFDLGTSVRDASLATAMSDTYRNADGSWTLVTSAGARNFKAADGSWRPIDLGLARGTDGRLAARSNNVGVSLAGWVRTHAGLSGVDDVTGRGNGVWDSPELASVTLPSGQQIGFGLQGAVQVDAVVSGPTATYHDILPNVDVVLESLTVGLKDTMVLKSRAAADSWVVPLRLQGLTARVEPDGSVALLNTAGKVVASIPHGFMTDSKIDPISGDGAYSDAVSYELTTVAGGGPALRVSVDRSWLDDPARTFPVRVDPSVAVSGSAFVQTQWANTDTSGLDNLRSGTYNGGSDNAMALMQFSDFSVGGTYFGAHVSAVTFGMHVMWTGACTSTRPTAVTLSEITGSWSPSSVRWGNKPSLGRTVFTGEGSPNSTVCGNSAADPNVGAWWTFNATPDVINTWTSNGPNNGVAVTTAPHAGNTINDSWLKFSSVNTGYAPYLSVTYTLNIAPQINAMYPPTGYSSPSLTPELLVTAVDADAAGWPAPLSYRFRVVDAAATQTFLVDSVVSTPSLTVPAGVLSWGKTYIWWVVVSDGPDTAPVQYNTLYTTVPQPPITSGLSSNGGVGVDARIGNYTTSATDAQVAGVGPALSIARSYNSRDPRTGSAFGPGWSSLLDAKATPAGDTVVVTYPSGQDVAFGRNADGTFLSPSGRYSTFTSVAGGYTLRDKDGTTFTFTKLVGSSYRLVSITDAQGRTLTLGYNGSNQVSTVTGASGRKLTFTWNADAIPHVSAVATDQAVPGDNTTVSTWSYTYTGGLLTKVCPPTSATACTTYGYASNSLYPTAVMDAGPHTYLRLGESSGAAAAVSEAIDNVDTATGVYTGGVTLGAAGGLPGSAATAITLDGTSGRVGLPSRKVGMRSGYQTLSLWFKTATAGVLLSYQKDPITAASTAGNYNPALYVGTDHKLHAKLWGGSGNPIVSPSNVDNSVWHHAVLVASGGSQTLYVDGVSAGSLTGAVAPPDADSAAYEYVGAGFSGGSTWPASPFFNASSATGYPSFFAGSISDFAFYDHALRPDQVALAYQAGSASTSLLTTVTRPLGGVSASVVYDAKSGVVKQVTDANNGVWKVGVPSVVGTSAVYASAVLGGAPADYYRLKETGVVNAVDEVNGGTAVMSGTVAQGTGNGPFLDTTVAGFDGTAANIYLPLSDMPNASPSAMSMWFRLPAGNINGGVLWSYQSHILSQSAQAGGWIPGLYVGTDGRLRGELMWTGNKTPITSMNAVNDGNWHHVAITAIPASNTQSMWLDGAKVGTLSATIDTTIAANYQGTYLGAGKWYDAAWPWPGASTSMVGYWPGQIAEYAYFKSTLDDAAVALQYGARARAGVSMNLLRGTGTGTVQPAVVGLGAQCSDATSVFSPGDFDGDGKADVLCRTPDSNLWLNKGNGLGGFQSVTQIGIGWNNSDPHFSPGDWNGDGKPDVIYRRDSDAKLFYIAGNGTGSWITGSSIEIGQGWYNMPFSGGDWDGDGKPDVLYRNLSNDDTLYLIRGNGTGSWINGQSVQVATGFHNADAMFSPGDFSGDGKPDLVYRRPDGSLYLLRGNGTGGVTGPETLIATGFGDKENIMSAKDFDGDGKNDILYRLSLGSPGKTVKTTDPAGNDTTRIYDVQAGNRLIESVDPRGGSTRYGYDTGGFLKTTTDPNGNMTIDEHDKRGNVLTHTTCQDRSAGACSTTTYTYYAGPTLDQPVWDVRNDLVMTVKDPRGYTTSNTYDAKGNLTTTLDPLGRVSIADYTDGTTVQAVDPVTFTPIVGVYAPAGLPYRRVSPAGAVTLTSYLASGDVAQTVDPAGLTIRSTYDGIGRASARKSISDTYPVGLTTTFTYDKQSRVWTETGPAVVNRVTGATHTRKVTMTYDDDGHLATTTAADLTGGDTARTVTSHYNTLGQLDWTDDPSAKRTAYTYDLMGRKATVTDPVGVTTAYTYDKTGNLTVTTVKAFTGDPNNPVAAHDQIMETRAYDPAGRLASVTDAMGWVSAYTYTDNNLPVATTRTDGAAQSYVVESDTYDEAGNLKSKTTNNGATVTNITVDAASRPTKQVVDPSGVNRTTDYTYAIDDTITSTTIWSGSSSSTADSVYDLAGRPVAQGVRTPGAALASSWWKLDDTTGTTAVDASGGRRPATGAVTWTGGAAQFNGTSQAVSTAGPVLDTTGGFTVSAWLKADPGYSSCRNAVSQDAVVTSGFSLGACGSDWQFSRPTADVTNASTNYLNAPLTTGVWTHVVGVYDPTLGKISLYVNGTAAGTTTAVGVPSRGALNIGRSKYNGAAFGFWPGAVSNVQVYPRALSTTDVATLYGNGRTGATMPKGTATTVGYDQRGLTTAQTDPLGNTTDLSYDEAGRLVVSTAPAVSTEDNGGTPVVVRPTRYIGYDTFGGRTETKDPKGRIVVSKRDAKGRVYETDLPAYTPPGGTAISPVAKTFYDDAGRVFKTTDPLLHDTTAIYDQLGRVAKVTTPDGGVSKATYDLDGDVLSTVDPTGAQASATYDYLGRTLTTTQVVRQPSTQTLTTTYAYHPQGWLRSVTPPGVAATQYDYNTVGETVKVTDAAGNATVYGYDFAGRQLSTTMADSTSQLVTYDPAGNPTLQQSKDATGVVKAAWSAAFDTAGRPVSATDPNGHATTFTYNALGQLTQQVEPLSATDSITTSFGYDTAGARTRFTDGRGNPFITTYNTLGLPESTIEPATSAYPNAVDRTFTTVYNAAGQPVEQRSPGGVKVVNTLDVMGRVLTSAGTGAEVSTVDKTFTYDLAGRPLTLSGSGGSNTLTWDDRGLLLTATGGSGNSSFAYNTFGAMTTRTDAAGTTSYGYDTAGRLSTVANTGTTVAVAVGYNTLNQPTQLTYGTNQNRRVLGYDPLHRLTTDELKTSGGTSIGKIVYGYDFNSNETSKTTTGFTGAAANTYTYDWANRLTKWNDGTGDKIFAYDKSGNRTQADAKTFTYDQRNQLLTSPSAGTTYQYTARGTLKRATTGTTNVDTQADAFNQVVKQYNITGTVSSDYTYDGLGRAIRAGNSYTGLGNDLAADSNAIYTRGPAGSLLGVKQAGAATYAWTDLHTDVVAQFTATATALSGSVTYNPLGAIVTTSGMVGNLGYQSEYTDALTKRVNMAARWYNPDTGQFDTRDTAANGASPASGNANRYAYANTNPLTLNDPSGHIAMITNDEMSERAYVANPNNVKDKDAKNATRGKALHHAANSGPANTAPSDCRLALRVDGANDPTHRGCTVRTPGSCAFNKADKTTDCPTPNTPRDGGGLTYRGQVGPSWGEAFLTGLKATTIDALLAIPDAARALNGGGGAIQDFIDGKSNVVELIAALLWEVTGGNAVKVGKAIWGILKEVGGDLYNFAISDVASPKAAEALGRLVGFCLMWEITGPAAKLISKASTALKAEIRATGRIGEGIEESTLTTARTSAATGEDLLNSTAALDDTLSAAAAELAEFDAATAETAGASKTPATSPSKTPARGKPAKPGCHSFDPDTRVLMDGGTTRAIKDINIGDKVVATDPHTGVTTTQPVTALHHNQDWDLTDITISTTPPTNPPQTTSQGNGNRSTREPTETTLHTTWHHPFWDATSKQWVNASELEPGKSTLTGPHGEIQYVAGVRNFTDSKAMNDLTIDVVHTYYVVAGDAPILVHNCGGGYNTAGKPCGCDAPRIFVVDSAGETTIMPVHEISQARFPGVWETWNRLFNRGGSPLVDRVGNPLKGQNRNAALAGLGARPPGMSWDEAPFASTAQGGAGAEVNLIPLSENVSHGRDWLWPFLRDNDVAVGDPYYVRIVP